MYVFIYLFVYVGIYLFIFHIKAYTDCKNAYKYRQIDQYQ